MTGNWVQSEYIRDPPEVEVPVPLVLGTQKVKGSSPGPGTGRSAPYTSVIPLSQKRWVATVATPLAAARTKSWSPCPC
jgi:hypothetical protein